jgi:hypothetical protein
VAVEMAAQPLQLDDLQQDRQTLVVAVVAVVTELVQAM